MCRRRLAVVVERCQALFVRCDPAISATTVVAIHCLSSPLSLSFALAVCPPTGKLSMSFRPDDRCQSASSIFVLAGVPRASFSVVVHFRSGGVTKAFAIVVHFRFWKRVQSIPLVLANQDQSFFGGPNKTVRPFKLRILLPGNPVSTWNQSGNYLADWCFLWSRQGRTFHKVKKSSIRNLQ